jgi:hypothetical protein
MGAFYKTMKYILFIWGLALISSCKHFEKKDSTKRRNVITMKDEREIRFPIANNFILYSYLASDSTEFFTYANNNQIYFLDIKKEKVIDSVDISLDSTQSNKYGEISSYCFNGKDSLFLLLDKGIFFFKSKTLKKVIPINELDASQYKGMRFANLENSPIFFDKVNNEIIGQVYCSICGQGAQSFYTQKIIGHISLNNSALKLYDISYSDMYKKKFYGFANHVYTQNSGNSTFISFPCDENIYELNRQSNTFSSFEAKSKFQETDALPLSLDLLNSREEKMKHMITVPYYSEIRYDSFKHLFYRFFLKDIPLKNKGKFNNFNDKGLVLSVINLNHEIIGEYELSKYYNNFISFVGQEGLYINFFSNNPLNRNNKTFKLLTFKYQ